MLLQNTIEVGMSKIELINANIDRICNKYPIRYKRIIEGDKKTCSKCRRLKSLDMFYSSIYSSDGKWSQCRECTTGKSTKEIGVTGKIINGKKKCSKCRQWKVIKNFSKNCAIKCGLESQCKKCQQALLFKETRRIRIICMLGYGGRCICCGENNIELLTIEHIRNKRFNHIRGNTRIIMKELIRLRFPKDHTVLCFNCNMSTANGTPCIHSPEYRKYYNKNIRHVKYNKQVELDELERQWNIM